MKIPTPFLFLATASLASAAILPTATIVSETENAAGIEFFEKHIRPVLAQKCYDCHSKESGKEKGGLRLDTREGIQRGGDSGHAVVPGVPGESLLLKAMRYEDKEMQMPPKKEGGKLPDEVIAKFEQWIKMGAPDPRTSTPGPAVVKKNWDMATAKNFWAFQLPKASPAPAVRETAWPRNDVDKFILAGLEAKNLKPVADASKEALIRRVYFDLIGLPPRPDEVIAFVNDKSPAAFAKVADRLLASPQFGERWGRHWLDIARFAESTGKERNFTFPAAWRYRDYVIASFNEDKPYNEFIREQIAGDLLPHANDAERNRQLIATGFLALGPKGLNEKNKTQFTMDLIDEQVDVTSRAVLGITVACARCHDHKFDPIPQRDYYALAGIFRSTDTYFGTAGLKQNKNGSPLLPLAGTAKPASAAPATPAVPSTPAAPAAPTVPVAAAPATQNLDARLDQLVAARPGIAARLRKMTPDQMARAIAKFGDQSAAPTNPSAPTEPTTTAAQPTAVTAKLAKKNKKGNGGPAPAALAPVPGQEFCMGVLEGRPTDTRILVRGEIDQPADTVPRGFVTVMTNGQPPTVPPTSSGRKELADWLVAPTNPLTARVAVNRVWQHLFGQGLVRTADNFGATGETPSHPELLDALALQFVREGWSVKKLVRTLVLSHTYQLSGAHDSVANEIDPDNRLLWHASQRRLDAEAIRDAMLAASGQLESTPPTGSLVSAIGDGYIGKGIKPDVFTDYDSKKRSIYLPVVRDFVPEMLDLFDFAEPSLVVASRDVTNVPSQALFMMNNDFVRAQAAAMAKRITATPLDYTGRLNLAYQLALCRRPTDAERKRADAYLLNEARALIPIKGGNKDDAALLSWSTFCQALFACAEFRYLQ
jgi:cytochrome c553